MDENKTTNEEFKEEQPQKTEITAAPEAETENTEEFAAETAETVETAEKPAKSGKKARNVLITACALAVAAAIMLVFALPAGIALLKGPTEVSDFQGMTGELVKYQNPLIFDFYAEETSGDATTGLYGLTYMNGKLVSLHYTQRYVENAKIVAQDSALYTSGQSYSLDRYLTVQGTVGTLSEDVETKLYDWYADNHDSLMSMGAVGSGDDAAEYLSDEVLYIDTVKGMDQTLAAVLSIAGAALLLIAIVLLVLLLCKVFDDKPEAEKTAEDESEDEYGESTEADAEEMTEDAAEADEKPEETAENEEQPAEADEKSETEKPETEENA